LFAGAYRKHFSLTPHEELSLIPLDVQDEQYRVARWVGVACDYDTGLYEHSVLVSHLTGNFAAYLGCTVADQLRLKNAALLHDIGKTRISSELLRKPTVLTPAESLEMRSHPVIGHNLLSAEGSHNVVTLIAVRDHHERLDGSGYPAGLQAAEISESVRIVTLCDVFAAMTEPRPYGIPFPWSDALNLMAAKRTRLDIGLLEHFAKMTIELRI
jgi:putative nucleotidyltransferase with HDIG domain